MNEKIVRFLNKEFSANYERSSKSSKPHKDFRFIAHFSPTQKLRQKSECFSSIIRIGSVLSQQNVLVWFFFPTKAQNFLNDS